MTVKLHRGETFIVATLELGDVVPPPIIIWQRKVFRQTSHSDDGWRYHEVDAYWCPHQ